MCYNRPRMRMMDRAEFDELVRNGLANLYDYATLETHALTPLFPPPSDQRKSRAEHLRHVLLYAIEQLKPPDREIVNGSVEWRPYLILHSRYVEGLSLQELQTRLALSERQLRREHGRALRAIAALLWDQAFAEHGDLGAIEGEDTRSQQWENGFRTFEMDREPLELAGVVQGVASMLRCRVQEEGAELHLVLSEKLPAVLADRVILRQILLSLLSYALDLRSEGRVTIGTEARADQVILWIQFQANDPLPTNVDTSLEAARYWAQRLESTLQETHTFNEQAGSARLALSLPRAAQLGVLVVDDQDAAIRMFRRFLSRFGAQVIGVQEPEQVLPLARQLQPQVITLDVMMPTMDGWEILQALQADPETNHSEASAERTGPTGAAG